MADGQTVSTVRRPRGRFARRRGYGQPAKLAPADRAAAEGQKFCAVQDGVRLGSMGPPVKVTVKGKDVFLCCEACRAAALKDPDKTAATAEKNAGKK